MSRPVSCISALVLLGVLLGQQSATLAPAGGLHAASPNSQAISRPASSALAHLRAIMDQHSHFNIYTDKFGAGNHFDPSGFMGDTDDIAFADDETAVSHSGGNSIRIDYTPSGQEGWAGIYWQHPKDNWGDVPDAGFDLTGVSRLTFWAKGKNGDEKAEFKVGGITEGDHPDSLVPAVSTGVLSLSNGWRQYSIDLDGKDLSYVIGGFVWVTTNDQNPNGATIYLDDIRFEEYDSKLRLLESYVSLEDFQPPRPMDTHRYLYVFQDEDSPFNVYHESGWMGDYGDINLNSADASDPGSGTALRFAYSAAASQDLQWAGVYWQAPAFNWGDRPGGYDLTGAVRLTFLAKGEVGGEKIEFLVGGITGPYHDSLQPPLKTGVVELESAWQQYAIDLTGADLSRISGGFAWTARKADNPDGATFYLDAIRYENAASPLGEAYPGADFPTDSYSFLAAHTYDNALALLAFLASGTSDDAERARLLADSLVWAQRHDEIPDGRIRNVYYADDLQIGTNYGNTGEIARHTYDMYGNGAGPGNTAWAMIALLSYYERHGGNQYLRSALDMGKWIVDNTQRTDGKGGYAGGIQGWEPNPEILTYRSTEHNLDVYVAFLKLHEATRDATWMQNANHAKSFLDTMWNDTDGFFYTGTTEDGATTNDQQKPLDVNPWGFLALGEVEKYGRGLTYARDNHYTVETIEGDVFEGFDFDNDNDGVWWEGTGQMAVAFWAQYFSSSDELHDWSYDNATKFRDELREAQNSAPRTDGRAIVAANRDELTTGFDLPTGGRWYYFNRRHVGATAWFIFSELQWNPFWGIPVDQPMPPLDPPIWCNVYLPYVSRDDVLKTATPTLTPTASPTPRALPTSPGVPPLHPVYVGERLSAGYDLGVDSSGGLRSWVTDERGSMRMDYPGGQDWGTVFITVGPPTPQPRPCRDLSMYSTLSMELMGGAGGEEVWIGLKDCRDPDNGRETKIKAREDKIEKDKWTTHSFSLTDFRTADLTRLYVVTEFVFESGTPPETIYFRNIQFLP